MFWKKKCKNCNVEVNDKWNFCQNCGVDLMGKSFGNYKNIDRQMEVINKTLEENLGFPRFRVKSPVRGVSITITSGTGMQPRVEVKTSGVHKHHEHAFPVKEPEIEGKKEIRIPKFTEEPETKIQHIGKRQIITINLADVKEEDVQIKQLEQSIEIRAIAGNKGYFKLLPVPANAYVDKQFKNGILTLEIVK